MIEELKKRYETLYGYEPSPPNAVRELESLLRVQLPEDFKAVATFFSGGYLGGKSLNTVSREGNATNIITETERLRATIDLPRNMVVLAEPASSLIVMECLESKGRVIWIDATDAPNLTNQDTLRSPDVWENYSDFFQELLDEEEEERRTL